MKILGKLFVTGVYYYLCIYNKYILNIVLKQKSTYFISKIFIYLYVFRNTHNNTVSSQMRVILVVPIYVLMYIVRWPKMYILCIKNKELQLRLLCLSWVSWTKKNKVWSRSIVAQYLGPKNLGSKGLIVTKKSSIIFLKIKWNNIYLV